MTFRVLMTGIAAAVTIAAAPNAMAGDRASDLAHLFDAYSQRLSSHDVEAVFPGRIVSYQTEVTAEYQDWVYEFRPEGMPYHVNLFREFFGTRQQRTALFSVWEEGNAAKVRDACIPVHSVLSDLMASGWSGPQVKFSKGRPYFALQGHRVAELLVERDYVIIHIYSEFHDVKPGVLTTEADAMAGCVIGFDERQAFAGQTVAGMQAQLPFSQRRIKAP